MIAFAEVLLLAIDHADDAKVCVVCGKDAMVRGLWLDVNDPSTPMVGVAAWCNDTECRKDMAQIRPLATECPSAWAVEDSTPWPGESLVAFAIRCRQAEAWDECVAAGRGSPNPYRVASVDSCRGCSSDIRSRRLFSWDAPTTPCVDPWHLAAPGISLPPEQAAPND